MEQNKIWLEKLHAEINKEIMDISGEEACPIVLEIANRIGIKVFTCSYGVSGWGKTLHDVITVDIPFDETLAMGEFERKLDMFAYDLNVNFAGAKALIHWQGYLMSVYEGQHYDVMQMSIDEYEDIIEEQEQELGKHKLNLEIMKKQERKNGLEIQ